MDSAAMCTWTVPTRIPHEDVCQSNGWLWNLSCTEPSRHRLMCNTYSNTIVNYSFPKKQFFFARWSYGVLLWETVTLGKNESTSSSYQVYKRFPISSQVHFHIQLFRLKICRECCLKDTVWNVHWAARRTCTLPAVVERWL